MKGNQDIQEDEYNFPYHYKDLARTSSSLLDFQYRGFVRFICKFFVTGKTVLDCGCGDGRIAYELKSKYYMGIDYSDNALRFAKAFNPHNVFLRRDLTNLNMKCKFDTIFLLEVLEHIPPEDIPKVLDNITKHCHKKTRIIITVPSKRLRKQDKHYQHFTEDSLERLLNPYFVTLTHLGLNRCKHFKKFNFAFWNLLGYFLLPFNRRFKLGWLYKYLEKYYLDNILKCGPNEGQQILMECTLR